MYICFLERNYLVLNFRQEKYSYTKNFIGDVAMLDVSQKIQHHLVAPVMFSKPEVVDIDVVTAMTEEIYHLSFLQSEGV